MHLLDEIRPYECSGRYSSLHAVLDVTYQVEVAVEAQRKVRRGVLGAVTAHRERAATPNRRSLLATGSVHRVRQTASDGCLIEV
ncbi:hypothetical protein HYPSUDRAFT_209875 [Hypholoma sublateritium FD-334 SS-4]|uniref:Uncharacterized protein n=1 Tax=Hypholoma sublateritium (strain FD-334 SS-4) TaxID=945553 RepID=A0A0D2NWY5_HYPSF|nr:hypothetical protein HYPSUDRAFT_209875 [Hypholoma sublateritium FD-334 SS-4]